MKFKSIWFDIALDKKHRCLSICFEGKYKTECLLISKKTSKRKSQRNLAKRENFEAQIY